MILVDTSIWVHHLRATDKTLAGLLLNQQVLMHPFVVGELALGGLPAGGGILALLHRLPTAATATTREVLRFITDTGLAGRGIGYVDTHLLASARLTPGATVWTRDRRLLAAAAYLRLAARLPGLQ